MDKNEDVKIKEFIKNFNDDFKCNIPSDTKAFLVDLYENFIIFNTSNNAEKDYIAKIAEVDEKINTILKKEQLELYNKFDKLKDEMYSNTIEQAFVYGYCVCELLHNITNTN